MRSSTSFKHLSIVVMVSLHVLALCLYVLPIAWVPEGLRVLAVTYVRPLFHQQWQLFAPDPPLCSSAIEVSYGGDLWQELFARPDHYLEERITRNISHHVRAGVDDGGIHPSLKELLLNACNSRSAEGTPMFRLRAECVTDVHHPSERSTVYTLIAIR